MSVAELLDDYDIPQKCGSSVCADAGAEMMCERPGMCDGPEPTVIEREKVNGALLKMLHGTTTLGFMYQGGVIISVDSRSTMGTYVASGTVQKVLTINPFLLGTMAGGAADCAFWERELGMRIRLFELRNHVERMSVAAASKMLANTLAQYHRQGYDLSIGTMIAGWDLEDGGKPGLYYVDNEGKRMKGNLFSVGSGSTYAYGVLDAGWRWDLTEEEACELGRRAIFHATHRDAFSGGVVNVYSIGPNGWRKISGDDQTFLHYNPAKPYAPLAERPDMVTPEEEERRKQSVLNGVLP